MWRAALGGLVLGALVAFLVEFLRPRRLGAESSPLVAESVPR